MPEAGQALKGHLELLLLGALADGPEHGYALIERLRDRSGGIFDLAEGTVYPALHRLDRSGLVTSRWDEAHGRRRRVYRLSQRGRRGLERQRRDFAAFARAVALVTGKTEH
jgi:PadR family transcriptional regulator, regulatory protein PadR